jgi:4-hydroxy-4-methyl-2-oxoglutarate aldolase
VSKPEPAIPTSTERPRFAERAGHEPVIVVPEGVRPATLDPLLVERFRTVPVPDVSDAVGALYTMASRIRPLYAMMPRVLGAAITVKAVPGDNWAIHAGLSRCQAGDVLVVDWRGFAEACGSGALTTALAMRHGLAGIVIDGAWRDVADLRRLRFPIMATGASPHSAGGRRLGEIDVPVSCGGVVVSPGDLIVGDEEGVAVVPRAHIERVAAALPVHVELQTADDPIAIEMNGGLSRTAAQYWDRVAQQVER